MLDEERSAESGPGVVVRAGSRWIRLPARQRVPIKPEEEPAEALAPVRCEACGQTREILAPITYWIHDDDHYGYLEVWYESRHAGQCDGCGAQIAIELSYTRTKWILSDRCELALDSLLRAASGGALGSCPRLPDAGDA